ncbi:MAG: oligosaccharide flippase family protein [Clostridiales bacterium]|nr:oligosaccharide flippase family protein [Clostridiales bacterium]
MILFNTVSNLILTPVYLHSLGTDGYGFYQMIYAVASYILVLDFGIGTTMVRFISEYRAKGDKKGEENFAFYCGVFVAFIAVAVVLVGLVINANLERIYQTLSAEDFALAHKMFLLMLVVLVFTVVERFFEGIAMSYEYFSVAKLIGIAKLVVKFTLVLLFLSGGMGVLSLIYVDIISLGCSLALFFFYDFFVLRFRVRYHYWDSGIVKPIATFTLAILLQSVVGYINNTADKTILGIMLGKTATGIYSVAMTFITVFNMLPTAISNVFLPQATKMVVKGTGNREMTNLVIRPGRMQFIICGGILGGFLILGRDFIALWAGDNVMETWLTALIIMVPNMIPLIQNVCNNILDAKNKRMFRSLVMLGLSVFNIILTVILIQQIGLLGAPIATGIAYLIGYVFIMNIYYRKKIGLEVGRMFREIFSGIAPSLLVACLICLPLYWWKQVSWITFLIKAAVFCLVYAALLLWFGVNQQEKAELKRALQKFKPVRGRGA